MKALVLSDLHLPSNTLAAKFYNDKTIRQFKEQIKDDFDIVLISGDVVESSIIRSSNNPLEYLYNIFNKPVIFCLGNHEFAYQDFNNVIKYWSQWKHPHVHCLDVDGSVQIENVNFVGNVFWYDFSLNKNPLVMQGEILDGWLDATIENFDPIHENIKCQRQIVDNLSKDMKNVLITHMVPHIELNWFSLEQPHSPYNAYSGNYDFLGELSEYNVEYAICGHTHKRICKEINGIKCINIGNDYFFRTNKIEYMIIEL